MSTSTTIDKAFEALYASDDGSLDTAASLLAADPGADAELVRRGEAFVRTLWERGWQPADVVRLARRDLADEHLRALAALIRTETARYERLPHRWRPQLDELDEQAFAPGRPTDRFSYATTVLELYRLLVRLPRLDAVGPVPGESLPPAAAGEPRMLTRIRALLAKAEATGYPEEAEALTAKAQELMARHSLDEATLAAGAPSPETPGAIRIGVEPPYEQAKAILLDAVATANHCRAVWNEAYGFSTVVGFEADLDPVELLHTSLLVQGTSAMTRAEAEQRAGGRKRTKSFRQSFLLAYANRLGTRLAATSRRVAAEAPTLLPALASRDLAVTTRTDELFPETRTARVRAAWDEEGWTHGASAADRAGLHPGRKGVRGAE
ncbi:MULTISPECIES: DUF2786 domain-containing protein [unclassified Streptomyces]|uniref:DUF2786 domain-containing protein n=1 Tax=unclassified Streptomyces TaxID=2593676 RepID=UPI0006FF731B|nr:MULTISPECIES: DUF2786 domain-containing protein [unclassified Streptomyces]KQX45612.1 aromatic acid decarboxylase [Streptomyces sp. Root1304]KRA79556.1 aromatic acid decarboxylase [Streptomyces sp. Root66D1]